MVTSEQCAHLLINTSSKYSTELFILINYVKYEQIPQLLDTENDNPLLTDKEKYEQQPENYNFTMAKVTSAYAHLERVRNYVHKINAYRSADVGLQVEEQLR